MEAKVLIDELVTLTHKNINDVRTFRKLSMQELNYKSNPKSWSILECIEHLNLYGKFYIPEIRNRIYQSNLAKSTKFKSGVLGNYFSKSMLPKEKLNKMKAFKSMNPIDRKLDTHVLDRFLQQQESLLTLLVDARHTDLTRVKTAISISKWIKLRLGDTFCVVIYHNYRHILQAQKVLNFS